MVAAHAVIPLERAPVASTTSPANVTYLDGLRGVAALVVAIEHYRDYFLPGSGIAPMTSWMRFLEATPANLLVHGHLAVVLFFIHSGFVLSWKYLHTGDWRTIASMGIRRAPRLGIPTAASILVSWVLFATGLSLQLPLEESRGNAAAHLSLFSSYPPPFRDALHDMLGGSLLYGGFRFNGSLWTMSIELFCSYAVFAALPLVIHLGVREWLLAIGLLAIASLRDYPWFVCFAIGALLARLVRDAGREGQPWLGQRLGRVWAPLLAIAVVLATYPSFSAVHLPVPPLFNPKELVSIVPGALIVAFALSSAGLQRFLSRPALRLLGRWSFPVYLLHLPVLYGFTTHLFFFLRERGAGLPVAWAITFPATMAVLLFASWLMSELVDQPSTRLGKAWLTRRLATIGPAPARI